MSEKINISPEAKSEAPRGADERSREVSESRSAAAELARKKLGETNIAELANRAKQEAVSGAEKPKGDEGHAQATRTTHDVHPFIHHAPATVLKHVRSQLPTLERGFSKVVNNPAVDRVSESLGKTIARPSGVFGGAISALIGVTVMNYFARKGGFRLSGGEFLAFLVLGWTLGMVLEKAWRKLNKA